MQSDTGLGRAIQVRRAELGLKRKDLAQLASLSYPYLSELENGTKAPSHKALMQLADALQLPTADLVARAEAMAPSTPTTGDMRAVSADSSPQLPERWKRLPVGEETSRGSPDRPLLSVADNGILDRIAELVTVTVRAELNAWAHSELPVLVREELTRLLEQAERNDS